MQLRDYQHQAISDLREAYREGFNAPLLVMPTGGGKTVIFTTAAKNAVAKELPVLVLVHRRELIDQTAAAFDRIGIKYGIICNGYPKDKTNALVQIASVQTLVNRLEKQNFNPGLLIIDEAHHAAAQTWKTVISHFHTAKLFGCTATPMRLDGRGLKDAFDHIVLGPSVKKLVEQNYLTKVRCFSIPKSLDRKTLTTTHSVGNDYAPNETAEMLTNNGYNGDAVAEYLKRCPGKPAIAFCCNIAHSEAVAIEFENAGFKAAHLHSKTTPVVRRKLIDDLGTGELDVLTSCNIVNEGTDIPIVAAAILLRPTKSEALYLQQVGRAMRPAPDKAEAIIIDCVGNVVAHGLPSEERTWTLEGRDKPAVPGCRSCPECHAIMPITEKICPDCGHIFAVEKAEAMLETKAKLDLVEITELMTTSGRKQAIANCTTKHDFSQVAKLLGYKPGWAWHMWQEYRRKYSMGISDDYYTDPSGVVKPVPAHEIL